MLKPLVLALALTASHTASAAWQLDNASSRLSFVSVKAGQVAEVHHFTDLAGMVFEDGRAKVTIQLASVDTAIPIRDERMRTMLFQTDVFPTASVSTRIDLESVLELAPGETQRLTAEMLLSLTGVELPITAELLVTRAGTGTVQIASFEPIVINAASVNLAEGVEKLREVAGLPGITGAVPVSFVLTFADVE